jgi:hypothetical protein
MKRSLHWRPLIPLLGILAAVQILLLVYYLTSALPGGGVPFDDAWIHFVFARNLAEHGEISFNLGQWSGGTTSILWDLLLATGYRLSGQMLATAYVLGAICYLAATAGLLILLATFMGPSVEGRGLALAGAVSFAAVGFIPYLALSGMDTLLFVALAVWTLATFVLGHRTLAAGLLAALVVTRIEGIGLAGVLAVATLIEDQFRLKPLLRLLFPSAALVTVYLAFNLTVTGSPLPTTMAGRKWLWGLPGGLWAFSLSRSVRFLRDWITLVRHFVLAGCRGIPEIAWVALVIVGAIGGAVKTVRRYAMESGFALLVGWGLVHNLAYLLLAPLASWRHQVPNLVVLPTLATTGCLTMSEQLTGSARRRWVAALGELTVVACLVPGIVGYRQAFGDHVTHINRVHVAAGQWIAESLPSDAVVAAFDIGAIKYFGRRETLDLGGLTDASFAADYLYPGRTSLFLRERGATHLAIPEPAQPGQTDLGSRLGIAEGSTGIHLKALTTFEVPPYISEPYSALPYQFYPAYRKITIYEVEQTN